jgi:hypothetical protein
MPNLSDLSGQVVGRATVTFVNQIARTDTSAKTLFTLPANAIPLELEVCSPAVSNAGTTATVSVGKSGGTGAEILAAMDVKGSTGSGSQNPAGPAASIFGASVGAAPYVVTGIYAESGTASTAGGPWLVAVTCIVAD